MAGPWLRKWLRCLHVQDVVRAPGQAKKLSAWVSIVWNEFQWDLATLAVARSAKVLGAAHVGLSRLYKLAHPLSGSYLGQLVLSALFQLSFQLGMASLRLYGFHSELLDLQFERMRRLHLGDRNG